MRITADLIGSQGSHVLTPIGERLLSLRRLKINQIENMGSTNDLFGAIDLSDNSLTELDNFPRLNNLRVLIANNNHISKFGTNLFSQFIPSLVSLVLTNNSFLSYRSLMPLKGAKNLERLSLRSNSVCTAPLPTEEEATMLMEGVSDCEAMYRLFLLHLVPTLRFLDFKRVTDAERTKSKDLFSGEKGEMLVVLLLKAQEPLENPELAAQIAASGKPSREETKENEEEAEETEQEYKKEEEEEPKPGVEQMQEQIAEEVPETIEEFTGTNAGH